MSETRKIAAILVADVVGYSRLAGADEDRTLARLRALRSDLIDPTIAVHHGRVVKRTGDGILIEFRSVVDAVRCAIEVQNGMAERNAGLPPERRIEFRIGIHLGDVVEESDGDLMGDGVNIAARLEGIAKAGAICLSEDAYRQVSGRLDMEVTDLGQIELKNIERPIRVYSLQVGVPAQAKPATELKAPEKPAELKPRSALLPLIAGIVALIVVAGGAWYFLAGTRTAPAVAPAPVASNAAPAPAHLSVVVLPFTNLSGDPSQDYFADGITENLTTDLSRIRNSFVIARNTAFTFKGKSIDAKEIGKQLGVRYVLEGSVQRDRNPSARQRTTHRRRNRRASLGRPVRGGRIGPLQTAGSGGRAIGQCVELRTRPGGSGNGSPRQKPRRHRPRYARPRSPLAVFSTTNEGRPHCHSSLVRTGAEDRPERR